MAIINSGSLPSISADGLGAAKKDLSNINISDTGKTILTNMGLVSIEDLNEIKPRKSNIVIKPDNFRPINQTLFSKIPIPSSQMTSVSRNRYNSVCYGNDRFVAVGCTYKYPYSRYPEAGFSAYSNDGENWNLSNDLSFGLDDAVYVNGKFYATSSSTSYLYVSVDGINWSKLELLKNFHVSKMELIDNVLYIGLDGYVYSSADGVTFNNVLMIDDSYTVWITCIKKTKFGIIVCSPQNTEYGAYLSADGITFNKIDLGSNYGCTCCYEIGTYVYLYTNIGIFCSSDGVLWVKKSDGIFLNGSEGNYNHEPLGSETFDLNGIIISETGYGTVNGIDWYDLNLNYCYMVEIGDFIYNLYIPPDNEYRTWNKLYKFRKDTITKFIPCNISKSDEYSILLPDESSYKEYNNCNIKLMKVFDGYIILKSDSIPSNELNAIFISKKSLL